MTCAPSEDLDQPGHPPSLISPRCALKGQLRTQALFMRTVDAHADMSLRWPHIPFGWFCHEVAQSMVYSLRGMAAFSGQVTV